MTDAQIIDAVLLAEGGFVNDLADRGRATNFGITQATLSQWLGRDATVEDVRLLSVDTAREIYRRQYLQPFDGVDPAVKPQVVDIAVNAGIARARQLLALAEAQSTRPVATQLVIERLRHYARIVRGDPTQARFMAGWTERAVRYL